MSIEKPYQPSEEEIKKAEEIMTEEQKEKSEEREATLEAGHGIVEKIKKQEHEKEEERLRNKELFKEEIIDQMKRFNSISVILGYVKEFKLPKEVTDKIIRDTEVISLLKKIIIGRISRKLPNRFDSHSVRDLIEAYGVLPDDITQDHKVRNLVKKEIEESNDWRYEHMMEKLFKL